MPNVNDLKNSKYLAKEDVMPDKIVTIESYTETDVSMDDKPTDMKWTLKFKEFDKPMVLNKTNGMLIKAITGSGEFDDWIGKKVVLWNDTSVMFAGEFTGGIRVRAIKTAGPTNVPAPVEDTSDYDPDKPDEIPY